MFPLRGISSGDKVPYLKKFTGTNGFLIEIQYTAIVFNRAQRAPASHGWFSINAVPEILILLPFFFLGGGPAPPTNQVLRLRTGGCWFRGMVSPESRMHKRCSVEEVASYRCTTCSGPALSFQNPAEASGSSAWLKSFAGRGMVGQLNPGFGFERDFVDLLLVVFVHVRNRCSATAMSVLVLTGNLNSGSLDHRISRGRPVLDLVSLVLTSVGLCANGIFASTAE